jgi:hypothetical protein
MPVLHTAILTLLCVGSTATLSPASNEPPGRPTLIHNS